MSLLTTTPPRATWACFGVDEVVALIAVVAAKPMRRSLPWFSSPIQKGAHTGRVGHTSVTGRVTHGRLVDQAAG
jgi:hypothetical protein